MAKKVSLYLWLETVTNFLYFFAVSPFRFRYDQKSEKYILVRSNLSTVIPLVIQSVGVFFTVHGLYLTVSSPNLQNPKCIFHLAVSYSRFIIYYALLFTFWTRRSHFESFFTSPHPSFPTSSNVLFSSRYKGLAWFFCFLMIPSAITIEILSYTGISGFYQYILATFSKHTGAKNFEVMLGLEQQTKLITSPSAPPPSLPLQSQLSPNFTFPPPPPPPLLSHFDFAFTTLLDVVRMYIRVCNHVAVLFCIYAGITLHQATTNFVTWIAEERDQDKVIRKYIDFCKFGSCLNKMCGCILLCTFVCSPPFFIVYLIGTFTDFEYTGPRVIFYSVLYSCLYIVASEASSKMGEFKEWIIEYGEGDNESQLFAIFVEISQNPIGLRGMGCFTITYGFLSKMFASIITFTIILLQFEITPGNTTNIACE